MFNKANFKIVVDSQDFDLTTFLNQKVSSLPCCNKVISWIRDRTGLKRTSGITSEMVPNPETNEIVSAWILRASKMNIKPTINFYIKEKMCKEIAKTVIEHEFIHPPSTGAIQSTENSSTLTEDNARCLIGSIRLLKINHEQKTLINELQESVQMLQINNLNLEQRISNLENSKRNEECIFKITDYVKFFNKKLLGESVNIDDFQKSLEIEKKTSKLYLGIKRTLQPTDYNRKDFVDLLLSKPCHKQLLDKYLNEGFKVEDFVFYQKSIVDRNHRAHCPFPPYIPNDEFKANIQYEIDNLSNRDEMLLEEKELKTLLEKMEKKF